MTLLTKNGNNLEGDCAAEVDTHEVPGASSLEQLAIQIRENHHVIIESCRKSVRHARVAGELLLKVQEQVGWGNWKQWVEDNLPEMSLRSAQAYKRVAEYCLAHPGQIPDLEETTLEKALLRLAKARSGNTQAPALSNGAGAGQCVGGHRSNAKDPLHRSSNKGARRRVRMRTPEECASAVWTHVYHLYNRIEDLPVERLQELLDEDQIRCLHIYWPKIDTYFASFDGEISAAESEGGAE